MRRTISLLSLLLVCGCPREELVDYGQVCVEAEDSRLVVEANSRDCAGDHKGASFECTITIDGSRAIVETVFVDGKDPNGACNGALETTCEAAVEPGSYMFEFAGEQAQIDVPGDMRVCLPAGLGETGD